MKQGNKSKNLLYALIIVSLLGFLDSLYLFYSEITGNINCLINEGIFQCETVNTSSYATFLGIHVSLWGIIFYVLLILFLFLSLYAEWVYWLGFLLPVASLFGLIFSIYLTAIEIFVIKALCEFCIFSALCSITIFVLVLLTKKKEYGSLTIHLDFWNAFRSEKK
ncbi:MAG: vitamin K epoxide reductase family protein [Candidatus Heimdallarchaeota archaeon]|nr:vitamin K epoxide reductase family protein [Candidatus Heimdallarchaeota archaeon]MCK4955056.1 vitamin K epoxide reductase family protein [Candidatus Heimdallarchaeota archaeon]